MPTLYPPDYPYRPDAPLLSFGPSFSEEISLSVIRATWHENDEQPHENEVRAAAALTMLEAFHPRDHLECMMAAQGVGFHCATLDNLARAACPGQSDAMVLKFRASAAAMNRAFLATSRELDRRHGKPLPPRPPEPTPSSGDPPLDDPPLGEPPLDAAHPVAAPPAPLPDLDDVPEIPEDIVTRPDGSPGSLNGYAPKPPPMEVVIPRIAPIMAALATRPGPYRIVNDPGSRIEAATGWPRSQPDETTGADTGIPHVETQPLDVPAANRDLSVPRGPLDVTERMFGGDSLARFAAARFDPEARTPLLFEDEESVVELELISTGGDPEAEAHRAAMIAAHPEGKPIVVFRHGARPAAEAPGPRRAEHPPDT